MAEVQPPVLRSARLEAHGLLRGPGLHPLSTRHVPGCLERLLERREQGIRQGHQAQPLPSPRWRTWGAVHKGPAPTSRGVCLTHCATAGLGFSCQLRRRSPQGPPLSRTSLCPHVKWLAPCRWGRSAPLLCVMLSQAAPLGHALSSRALRHQDRPPAEACLGGPRVICAMSSHILLFQGAGDSFRVP